MPEIIGVRVEGAREARRAFKKAQNLNAYGVFKTTYEDVAREVASRVRSRIPRGQSGGARDAITGWATNTKGFVGQKNRKAVPYYGWLDFGTRSARRGYRGGKGKHGPWWKTGKYGGDGRYIYPTLKANETYIARRLEEALDEHHKRGDLT